MKESNPVVYSLSREDIQNVAREELGRALTSSEIEIVEEHLGDYIKWYDIIETVIRIHVVSTPSAQ
jgi:hypothetical protein